MLPFRGRQLGRCMGGYREQTRQDGFKEFSGAFLVAIRQWDLTARSDKSIEGAWKSSVNRW